MKTKHIFFIIFALLIINTSEAQSILGIDVSKWQGTINWQQVYNSGKVFAYVKATEGQTYTDPKFSANASNGNAAGVVMGVYHFARPDNNSGAQDANNFLNVAEAYMGEGFLPPVLDLEDINRNGTTTYLSNLFTPAQLTAWAQEFITTVENQTGVKPIIYTNTNYAGYLNTSLITYGLWIAKPNTSPTAPPNSIGNWTDWKFKQYSWVGNVSGISGNVDLNVFHGSIDDFNTLIGKTPVANDDCSSATLLNSNSSCILTEGTVDNATSSGLTKASCDLYASNSLAADVFYKFVATDTTQTIFVNPTGDLDVVVTLFKGVDCNNLTEITCADNGGGFGQSETLTATNLIIDQTYWIRIYNFGSEPPSNGNFEICVTFTNNDSEDITLNNAFITSSSSINTGETVDVEVTQNYSGNSNIVSDVYLHYYLSTDCLLDNTDILLYDQDFSTINSNDPSDEESQSLTIPMGTTPGIYYILFVGDATNVINESDENNNLACAEITVTNGATQDIHLSNESITSSSIVIPGGTINTEVTQNYVGSANALPNIYISYYLSTNCELDNTDILLYDQDFSTLNSTDLSDEESQELTIPSGIDAGTYYIIFVGDATNVISESDENNNTACAEITVTDSISEDITLSNAVITSSSSINEGESITIEVTQNYSGPANIVPNVYLHYYLSTDCTLDNTDVLLDDQQFSTISSMDPSDEENHTLAIPHGTNLGKYYILVIADATNVINETDEDNNITCLQIFIKSTVGNNNLAFVNKILLYPNPTKGKIYLDINPKVTISNIEILNSLGQTIKVEVDAKNEIDLSNWPGGIYFVKLISSKHQMAVFRIIKLD